MPKRTRAATNTTVYFKKSRLVAAAVAGADEEEDLSPTTTPEGLPFRRDGCEGRSESEDTSEMPIQKTTRTLSHIGLPGWQNTPPFPRRVYRRQHPLAQCVSERGALSNLAETHKKRHIRREEDDHKYFILDDFTIYRPAHTVWHGLQLVSLHELSRDRHSEFCFDGVLSYGKERYFVQDVRFQILTVDRYDDPEATDMDNHLCVQSRLAAHEDVWYRLGKPAMEYQRFYRPFLWVTRFTKHAVQFMMETEDVTLHHFRGAFYEWMQRHCKETTSFKPWLSEAKTRDFAVHFVAYVEFLWKECHGVQESTDKIQICKHPVWGETLHTQLEAIPTQPNRIFRTVVTPYAYHNFQRMYFADSMMEAEVTDPKTRARIDALKFELGLAPWHSHTTSIPTPQSMSRELSTSVVNVVAGDVVGVLPDHAGSWKSNLDTWYAYVQRVWEHRGEERLDVIWLYHAEDTTLGKAYYRFPNELFFSDNCGCGITEALNLSEVTHIVKVVWSPSNPAAEQDLFIRQKFRTVAEEDQYDFIKLHESDFLCLHQSDSEPEDTEHKLGDTVLVSMRKDASGKNCEPAQIVGFSPGRQRVELRRLSFRAEIMPSSRANELMFTSHIFTKKIEDLVRKCHVRFFPREQVEAGEIPTPYDRDGAGDYYFISGQNDGSGNRMHDDGALDIDMPLNEGWDPLLPTSRDKLKGLGIFCGGGTFDRGLEEGGSVHFTHAVDFAEHVLHSYRANSSRNINFFLGSVDDYLSRAMSGGSDEIAAPGNIQIISAGSPCQGFSRLQLQTASPESMKNASMVASVVSFVDFYVPQFLILENVVTMTESIKERKEHNVFSQILAALVGLGYQVQQQLMDAWSYGSSQQRSRVFIIATAPNAVPPPRPENTHAHPRINFRSRKLGTSSNGLPFGTRRTDPDVAFPTITAAEAVRDLPPVYDSLPQLCPRFPDHKTYFALSTTNQGRIAMIPTRPHGCGMVQAMKLGQLRGEFLEYFESSSALGRAKQSKSYSRVFPNQIFPTIITHFALGDGVNGRVLHWNEDRPLTIMEARRAQGYPDYEVLIGTPAQKLKIVGNSVDRKVALVLGLALRESWLQFPSPEFNDGGDVHDAAPMCANTPVSCVHPPPHLNGGIDGSTDDAVIIDNRSVKISLNLTEEISGIKEAAERRHSGFTEIMRILTSKDEHIAARQALHGAESYQ